MVQENIKRKVYEHWDKISCGTEVAVAEKFSKSYFEEIEAHRYKIEPEIFSFAQFTRFKDKKVLEVGVGAGTDFLQWVRSGAEAYGIDLTPEAIENTSRRLMTYNLTAKDLRVADAENLPYEDNFFDLIYSWGVIHHSPDTERCLKEVIRVVKPGGQIKLMIYNRQSLFAFYRWFLSAFLRGQPFRSFKFVLFHNQESFGTKAYTFKEVRRWFKNLPIKVLNQKATVTKHDLLYYKSRPFRFIAYICAFLFGWNKVGWFMTIELKKVG